MGENLTVRIDLVFADGNVLLDLPTPIVVVQAISSLNSSTTPGVQFSSLGQHLPSSTGNDNIGFDRLGIGGSMGTLQGIHGGRKCRDTKG